MNNIKKFLPQIIITVLFVIVYASCFDIKPDMNGDNAQYMNLAYNLAQGNGYSELSTQGELRPASHFPVGYPFVLSLFMRLGIESVIFFKILSGLFTLCALHLVYYIIRGLTKEQYLAMAVVVLSIFSPRLMNFSYMIMSETLYMLLTVLSMYALFKFDNLRSKNFYSQPWFYVAIISATASYYTRTIGASAIFAIVVYFLFTKNWKATLASVFASVLLIAPWSIRNSILGIESRYLGTVMTVNPWRPEMGTISSVGEMVDKMITNLDDTVIKGFKNLLFPFLNVDFSHSSSLLAIVVSTLIIALAVYGAWKLGKLRYALIAFFVANVGLFMLWHGGNQDRYVIPLIPFIIALFWVGVYYLINLRFKFNALLILLVALPMISPISELSQRSKLSYAPGYVNYFNVLKSLDGKVAKNTVICCRKPEFMYFHAKDVIGVRYLYSLDDKEVILDMLKKNIDYVVIDQIGFSSTPRYLVPAINKNPELFEMMAQTKEPKTYLLRFKREQASQKFATK